MRLIFDIILFTAIGLAALFIYVQYWDDIMLSVFGEESKHTMFVGSVPVMVTVAETPEELVLGLSNTPSLGTNEGKLFIFEKSAKHGIWMKDMLFPIDIIWIDENLRVVHIEEQVAPESFPTVFAPPSDARFVLEVNAFFADALKLSVGDIIFIPPEVLPSDVAGNLQ